jgi:hypothetical protein
MAMAMAMGEKTYLQARHDLLGHGLVERIEFRGAVQLDCADAEDGVEEDVVGGVLFREHLFCLGCRRGH